MRCGESAAPPGSLERGRVLNDAALGQALRQLIARTEITTSRAWIAASDAIASFRVFTFPPSASQQEMDAAVRSQLNLGSDRMVLRHLEVLPGRGERTVFAIVWDRREVEAISSVARLAGLEPAVVDLNSLCLARALAIDSCLLLDLSAEWCEVILIDERVPRVWHPFKLESGGDIALAIANALKPVLGLHQRSAGAASGFGPESPILVRSDQGLRSLVTSRLEKLTGRPVEGLPQPLRIDADVRYGPYLTCLGLIMRRGT